MGLLPQETYDNQLGGLTQPTSCGRMRRREVALLCCAWTHMQGDDRPADGGSVGGWGGADEGAHTRLRIAAAGMEK